MTPPDPNVAPAPPTRGWKGGAWPVIAAAVALIGVYATLAVTHERPAEPRPATAPR